MGAPLPFVVPQRLRPSAQDLAAAHGRRTVRDVLAPDLDVLFVGINPGLYSGATRHHFARPGNRFWGALHRSGWTPRLLSPAEERRLPDFGIGLTKLVGRATATAAELSATELRRGAARIRRLVRTLRPRVVCFLGVGAYCAAYGVRSATVGRQAAPFEGTDLWVLPNPSGLNANYQMPDFVRLFESLRESTNVSSRATPLQPRSQASGWARSGAASAPRRRAASRIPPRSARARRARPA